MSNELVIEKFIRDGKRGRGSNIVAEPYVLYSTYERRYDEPRTPLLVRLKDGSFLANGASLRYWLMSRHQEDVLRKLRDIKSSFGVIPFDAIAAAYSDGETKSWNESPVTVADLIDDVRIVVPSTGEQWKDVQMVDDEGKTITKNVHTLGDSVVQIKNRYYLSAVDETGTGSRGSYFLMELLTKVPPASFDHAVNLLKPQAVLDAEAQGSYFRRQGEWFAIPTEVRTSELFADVERGAAVWHANHVLGTDGHHQLEEAVIYKAGPKKGEVYARGVLTHTNNEHYDLKFGFRWHRIVHNRSGNSYSMRGNFD